MPIHINKQTYVALDLETTGLVPESDAIIEVGAVKFQNGHQIGVFQSLVNPHRPIPLNIQRLCGISQEDVDIAPPFSALEEKLASFLEGCHPVGHNVSFDLNFLARNGIGLPHSGYDTFELAKLILPDLPERSLSAVAKYLAIPHPSAHRALADAEVSKEVFTQLLNRLHELDPCILNELARLTARADWWLGSFIRQVAEERGTSILLGEGSFENACFGSQKRKAVEPLTPHEEKTQLNVKALTRFFEHSGSLARAFPNYEKRPEQVRMMQAVAESLNESRHLIVEAGTGTGKSMAYLLPALLFAHQNNIPVVVSTNTINLQEQLVHKDIPDLLQAIGPDSDQSIPAIQ
ncbi:MAG: exonuclease domain-containing protein, partial [Chloroflexota bacterium]|nr:exonuclease domain-containing protein [Chloroflexota bacterium]